MQNLPPYKKLSFLFFYGNILKMIIFTPSPSTPVAIQFCTGIKLNSNISAGKYKKNQIHRFQSIFHRAAKQKLCSKNLEIR